MKNMTVKITSDDKDVIVDIHGDVQDAISAADARKYAAALVAAADEAEAFRSKKWAVGGLYLSHGPIPDPGVAYYSPDGKQLLRLNSGGYTSDFSKEILRNHSGEAANLGFVGLLKETQFH